MKTHYSPWGGDKEDIEKTPCGTLLGESSDLSGDWLEVDCRRCLRNKELIAASVDAEEKAIVEQLGDMAAFMKQQEPSHDNQ